MKSLQIASALALLVLTAPYPFAQSNSSTNGIAASSAIPEEARRQFVIGTTLFKEAKTPDDYLQVENHFKQAVNLAPNWVLISLPNQ